MEKIRICGSVGKRSESKRCGPYGAYRNKEHAPFEYFPSTDRSTNEYEREEKKREPLPDGGKKHKTCEAENACVACPVSEL